MKKLLFILLLLSQITFGQISISRVATTAYSTTGIANVSGITYNAGSLYIILTGTSNAGGTPATVSLAGTGQTWTEVGTAGGSLNSTSGKRIQAFRFAPGSNNSNAVNWTYTGTQDGGFAEVFLITGANVTGTNGSNGIIQSPTATSNAVIQPSITMSALQGGSGVLAGWINDFNPPTGTAESGWTEANDAGYATPTTGGYFLIRNNSGDNTPSWTAGSLSNWAGIAIEFKSAFRRIVITN